MFDSSGRYYGRDFPLFAQISAMKSRSARFKEGTVNVLTNATFDFITVGLVTFDDLHGEIMQVQIRIFAVFFAVLAAILALFLMGMRVFSSRIVTIMLGIKRMQTGDLAARIPVAAGDELGEIAHNLNDMSQKLSDHITKEFVAALRQKSAELYALQSQVNPHFLYNSLEVIRMKALNTGETDVARMIKTLAAIFRGSLAKGMVVSIREELELFSLRFAGRLVVESEVQPEILEYGILKHLLQPIIENYIIHGADFERDDNRIRIEGFRSGSDLCLVISDNGRGMTESQLAQTLASMQNGDLSAGGRIGVANVRESASFS